METLHFTPPKYSMLCDKAQEDANAAAKTQTHRNLEVLFWRLTEERSKKNWGYVEDNMWSLNDCNNVAKTFESLHILIRTF